MSIRWSKWYRTGESRIVPWYFGLMRAEFFWRRDGYDHSGELVLFQLTTRGTGRLPTDMDGPYAGGFWSTLATPVKAKYGWRGIFRRLCFFFAAPKGWDDQ